MQTTFSFSSYLKDHARPVFLFSFSFCVKVAVFCFLMWWYRVAGHLPDFGGHFPILGGDSGDYAQLTQNLFSHHIFSSSESAPLIPESFRLPGYSFFLYPFFYLPHPLIWGVLAQMLCASGTVVLTYLLGKKYLSESVGFYAALLLALEPTSILNSVSVMSDTVFVFTLFLSLYLLLSSYTTRTTFICISLLSGLLFGYAILTRVIAQYLALCVAPAYVFFLRNGTLLRRALLRGFLFCVGILIIILPWSLRNHAQFGTYTISSTPYISFTQYNLVYFYAYQHHVRPPEVQHLFSDPIPYPQSSFWFRSLINEPIFQSEIRDGLSGNLILYTEFHLIKALPFFMTDGLRDLNLNLALFPRDTHMVNFTDLILRKEGAAFIAYFLTPSPDLVLLLIGSSVWVSISLLWLIALGRSVLLRKKEMWFVIFGSGFILYFAVLSSPLVQPRYRIPATPFMLLFAVESAFFIIHAIRVRYLSPTPSVRAAD
jgi:4-amino-4-deoxy-L-arabinose transferase-like glycosyltransferase